MYGSEQETHMRAGRAQQEGVTVPSGYGHYSVEDQDMSVVMHTADVTRRISYGPNGSRVVDSRRVGDEEQKVGERGATRDEMALLLQVAGPVVEQYIFKAEATPDALVNPGGMTYNDAAPGAIRALQGARAALKALSN